MNAFVHRMLRLLTAVEFLLVSFRCFSFIRDINRKLNFSTKTETHLNRSTNWFFLRHRKVKILNKTLSKRKQNIHTHDDDNDDDVDDIDDIFNASSFYAKTKTLTNGKGTMIEFHYFLSFFLSNKIHTALSSRNFDRNESQCMNWTLLLLWVALGWRCC